jgi:hypothetical protein
MRLLRFFQERFGFTRTELLVVMLLTISLLIGTAISRLHVHPHRRWIRSLSAVRAHSTTPCAGTTMFLRTQQEAAPADPSTSTPPTNLPW